MPDVHADRLRPLMDTCAQALSRGDEHIPLGDGVYVDTTCARDVLERVARLLQIPGPRDPRPDDDRSAACG